LKQSKRERLEQHPVAQSAITIPGILDRDRGQWDGAGTASGLFLTSSDLSGFQQGSETVHKRHGLRLEVFLKTSQMRLVRILRIEGIEGISQGMALKSDTWMLTRRLLRGGRRDYRVAWLNQWNVFMFEVFVATRRSLKRTCMLYGMASCNVFAAM
jgi:hypothetical protein